jgi:hypothetical protein
VIKSKGVLLLAISFLAGVLITFIVFIFFDFYPIVVLPLFWVFFAYNTFYYNKIIINNDGLTFDALCRQKTFPFEVFRNANIILMSGATIYTKDCVIGVYFTLKTKDGLIKIVTLSETITEKEKLINKIEWWANLL